MLFFLSQCQKTAHCRDAARRKLTTFRRFRRAEPAACMIKDVAKRPLRDAGLNIAPLINSPERTPFSTFAEANFVWDCFKRSLSPPIRALSASKSRALTKRNIVQQAVALAFEFSIGKSGGGQGIKGRENAPY